MIFLVTSILARKTLKVDSSKLNILPQDSYYRAFCCVLSPIPSLSFYFDSLYEYLLIILFFLLRFGSTNARVGGPNLKLTRVNDKTVEIMLKAREGKFEGGADTFLPEYSSVSINSHSQ